MSRKVSGRLSSVSRRSPTGRRPVSSGTSGTRESREESTDEGRLNTPSVSSSSSNIRLSGENHDGTPYVTAPNSLVDTSSDAPGSSDRLSQNDRENRDEIIAHIPRTPLDNALNRQTKQEENTARHASQALNDSVSRNQRGNRDEIIAHSSRTPLDNPLDSQTRQEENTARHASQALNDSVSRSQQGDGDEIISLSLRAPVDNIIEPQVSQSQNINRYASQELNEGNARNNNRQGMSKNYLHLTVLEVLAITLSRGIAPIAVVISNYRTTMGDKKSSNISAGESLSVFLGVTLGAIAGFLVDKQMIRVKRRTRTHEIVKSFYDDMRRRRLEAIDFEEQAKNLLRAGKAARDEVLSQNDIYGGLSTSFSSLLAAGLSRFSPIAGISAAVDSVLVFALAGMVLSPSDSSLAKLVARLTFYVPSSDSEEGDISVLADIRQDIQRVRDQNVDIDMISPTFSEDINAVSTSRNWYEIGFCSLSMVSVFAVHVTVTGISTKVGGGSFSDNTGVMLSGFAGALGAAVGMVTVLKGYWQREDARTSAMRVHGPHND